MLTLAIPTADPVTVPTTWALVEETGNPKNPYKVLLESHDKARLEGVRDQFANDPRKGGGWFDKPMSVFEVCALTGELVTSEPF